MKALEATSHWNLFCPSPCLSNPSHCLIRYANPPRCRFTRPLDFPSIHQKAAEAPTQLKLGDGVSPHPPHLQAAGDSSGGVEVGGIRVPATAGPLGGGGGGRGSSRNLVARIGWTDARDCHWLADRRPAAAAAAAGAGAAGTWWRGSAGLTRGTATHAVPHTFTLRDNAGQAGAQGATRCHQARRLMAYASLRMRLTLGLTPRVTDAGASVRLRNVFDSEICLRSRPKGPFCLYQAFI